MNDLKPLSLGEALLVVEYLSSPSSYEKPIEFVLPTMGAVYVEEITYAPYFEIDYKDFVKRVECGGSTSGHYWGHTYRVVVIVEKENHFRSAYCQPKVFTIQELQQLGVFGFEYPEDLLDELEDEDAE